MFLQTAFHLSAVALLVVKIFELNFEVILHITFFVLVSPGYCFKFAIWIQNPLHSAPTLQTHGLCIYLQKHPKFPCQIFLAPKLQLWHLSRSGWTPGLLQGNQRKINKTNCLNHFSFTMSKNVQHKRPVLKCWMLNSLQIQSVIATTNVFSNYYVDSLRFLRSQASWTKHLL